MKVRMKGDSDAITLPAAVEMIRANLAERRSQCARGFGTVADPNRASK
jgi:hypothetical protein